MLSAACLMMLPRAHSTHVPGMDLTLTNIGGSDYMIRLAFYRDCAGINAPATVAFVIECTSNPTLNFNVTGVPLLPGSGQEITPICPTMGTTGSSGQIYGYEEYVLKCR